MLAVSIVYLLWFVLHRKPPPFPLGTAGYATMCFVWIKTLVMFVFFHQRPEWEDTVACMSAIVILGVFALFTGPKHGMD